MNHPCCHHYPLMGFLTALVALYRRYRFLAPAEAPVDLYPLLSAVAAQIKREDQPEWDLSLPGQVLLAQILLKNILLLHLLTNRSAL